MTTQKAHETARLPTTRRLLTGLLLLWFVRLSTIQQAADKLSCQAPKSSTRSTTAGTATATTAPTMTTVRASAKKRAREAP